MMSPFLTHSIELIVVVVVLSVAIVVVSGKLINSLILGNILHISAWKRIGVDKTWQVDDRSGISDPFEFSGSPKIWLNNYLASLDSKHSINFTKTFSSKLYLTFGCPLVAILGNGSTSTLLQDTTTLSYRQDSVSSRSGLLLLQDLLQDTTTLSYTQDSV